MPEQTQQKSEPDIALERLTQRVAMETYELGGTKRVMHEIESYVSTLRAEQTRLREALRRVRVYVASEDGSWRGEQETLATIDAALSSTTTPEQP